MPAATATSLRSAASAPGVAAFVDPSSCPRPRLRALASVLGGRPVAVIGTGADAERAASAGLTVLRSFQPPLGRVSLSGSALRRAGFGGRRFGTVIAAGARAAEAVRALGMRPEPMPDALPEPLAPLAAAGLRKEWGVRDGECACLLLASPASACDARAALDVAGRAAILGRPIVLVVHPDAGNAGQAAQLASAAGGAWRIAFDERAEEPELLASGVAAALAFDRRLPIESVGTPARGVAGAFAAFVRGARPPIEPGDPIAIRLAVRAGLPAISCGTAGDAFVPDACRFDPRRPSAAARALSAQIRWG
ncbi:MAG: hypothetical protein ACKPBA_09225 [Planctomycetota bacterium]